MHVSYHERARRIAVAARTNLHHMAAHALQVLRIGGSEPTAEDLEARIRQVLDPLMLAQIRQVTLQALEGKRPAGRPPRSASGDVPKAMTLPGTNRRLWRLGPVTMHYATSTLSPDVIDGEWARDDEVYLVEGVRGIVDRLCELVAIAYEGLPYPEDLYAEALEPRLDRLRIRISQRKGAATARIPYMHPWPDGAGAAQAVMRVSVARATAKDYDAYLGGPDTAPDAAQK